MLYDASEMRLLLLTLSVLIFAEFLVVYTHGTSAPSVSVHINDDSPSLRIWPIPKKEECATNGTPAALAVGWTFATPTGPGGLKCKSPVVRSALSRYRPILGSGAATGTLALVKTTVSSISAALSSRTPYGYSLSTHKGVVEIVAESEYGVGYALETLSQILAANECTTFSVVDAPEFVHRGLLIDIGRRFYPVDFVKRLVDGMSSLKMNVLHMHLSEQCFRVQSRTFPQLSSAPCIYSLTNNNNTDVYSHDDIRDLVAYANLRGVRLIPEFDIPGHSGGFCTTLKSAGIACCGDQILDDPSGQSVAIMAKIFAEMASLFPDEQMHIGGDETGTAPPCTLANTKKFEIAMIEKILSLGKQPAGWEELLFTTQAAAGYSSVVVHSWHHTHWEQVVDPALCILSPKN